jgi:sodium-coupled neutral amino acid transporter 11
VGAHSIFTDKTKANILSNFPDENGVINIARILFGINMFLTFPMECFVCREVVFQYLWSHLYHPSVDLTKEATELAHVTTTLVLVLSAMFIALSTCDLGFVLELTGGFAATVLSFILPPLCYLKLAEGALFSRKKLTSVFMIFFGVIVMILSTVISISNFLNGQGNAKC